MSYESINQEAYGYNNPKLFCAFNDEQFAQGLAKLGVKEECVVAGHCGWYGLAEGFEEQEAFFEGLKERIKKECKPEEIYSYEWWNRECGYTYEDSEALKITREYFPEYKPTKALNKKLWAMFEKMN